MQWQDAGKAPFAEHLGPTLPAFWLPSASTQLKSHRLPKKKKKKSLQEQEFHVNKHHTGMS